MNFSGTASNESKEMPGDFLVNQGYPVTTAPPFSGATSPTLLDRIDGWGRMAADRVAFRSSGRSLTYGELRAGSDALAGWLRQKSGAGSEPIAIHGHKEPEMLIGFLGAWKAGRAYVPIDLSLPPQRVAAIVRESGAGMVLRPAEIAEAIKEGHPAPGCRPRPEDPCYLIFTSGSTGEPKGVLITHGNLRHFLEWMLAEQQFEAGAEVFLNQANFSFDLSVMDLYLSLATGGTLFSLTREHAAEPARVHAALRGSGLTTWVSTPSFARVALLSPDFSEALLPDLRRFLFCGETLSRATVGELRRRFPRAKVWNTYGPTETTVATTSILVDEAVLALDSALPVGRAMPGTRVFILGQQGESVRDGTRGEIVIAGPNVSPGYVNAPEQNALAFREYEGQAAYHTGDWGHEHEGLIFFEGRGDHQVKLHGHRVELGEIEATLLALAEVAEAVVLPILRDDSVESLAAFVVLAEQPSSTGPAMEKLLRSRLGEQLPDYMVPREFHFLESFPLTANGKADRASLAVQAAAPHIANASAPWSRLEPEILWQKAASIWEEVLGVESVNPEDNFFDLGGNSLGAARVLLALERFCERTLPVTFLFQHPKLGQLVKALEGQAAPALQSSLISIQQGTLPPLFWLPGATENTTVLLGNAAYIFRLARALGPERTVYSVYQEHPPASTSPTIEKMAARLLADILLQQPEGPYYLAGWSFGGLMAYEIARQLTRAGKEVALIAIVDQVAPRFPRGRPWIQRPGALWKELARVPSSEKWSFPVTAIWRYLSEESTLLVRRIRRALGQRNDWDRVIHLETEYLTVNRPYHGRVILFVSPETLMVTERSISVVHDQNLGWSEVSARVETHVLAGTHHTIFDGACLARITDVLCRHLAAGERLPANARESAAEK